MKDRSHYYLLLLLCLFTFACHKEDEEEVYPSARIMGDYSLTYVYKAGSGGTTLTNQSAQPFITIASISQKSVHLTMSTIIASGKLVVNELGTFEVRKSNADYLLNDGSADVGRVENKTLKLDIAISGTKYYLEAVTK